MVEGVVEVVNIVNSEGLGEGEDLWGWGLWYYEFVWLYFVYMELVFYYIL